MIIFKLKRFFKTLLFHDYFNNIIISMGKKKKDHDISDKILGFLLGFSIGSIGMTILSLLSKPNCPVCKNKIEKGARYCPVCKTELEWK